MLPEYPKASLGGIPEEILVNIATRLRYNRDALAKLCRTDKRCRRIAEAVLYECIGPWHSNDHEEAHAISRWPALATNVRACSYDFDSKLEKESDRDAYIDVLENAHNIQDLKWSDGYFRFKQREMAYRRTCLDFLYKTVALFNKAVNQPFGAHNRFKQLKNIEIAVHSLPDGQRFPMETLSSLFQLPSLTSLCLQGLNQVKPLRNWTVPPSTSPIRKLGLWSDLMDITAITQIIASIKTLETFEYNYSQILWEPSGTEDDQSSTPPKHSWKLLGQAMCQHRDCLNNLLLVPICFPRFPSSKRDQGVLGSFADFSKLKQMHVPFEALFHADASEDDLLTYLPEQLETFTTRVLSKDTNTIISCLSMMESLWRHRHDRYIDLSFHFTRVRGSHLRKSPHLFEALKLLHASDVQNYVKVDFETFSLYHVLEPDLLEESSEEEEEQGED
ncbi:hypothetical protein yc1106_08028 [Curvularia clavata]|uniref:Uncharacterized protein n=1 Tax=Curvularia clavata TaxID=95742 RepID=A0A9Q9DWC5_CURCL|nr:hypothetical protein yc1106_08028 [Curvularia clavata]